MLLGKLALLDPPHVVQHGRPVPLGEEPALLGRLVLVVPLLFRGQGAGEALPAQLAGQGEAVSTIAFQDRPVLAPAAGIFLAQHRLVQFERYDVEAVPTLVERLDHFLGLPRQAAPGADRAAHRLAREEPPGSLLGDPGNEEMAGAGDHHAAGVFQAYRVDARIGGVAQAEFQALGGSSKRPGNSGKLTAAIGVGDDYLRRPGTRRQGTGDVEGAGGGSTFR